jgi:hypothetical protein
MSSEFSIPTTGGLPPGSLESKLPLKAFCIKCGKLMKEGRSRCNDYPKCLGRRILKVMEK